MTIYGIDLGTTQSSICKMNKYNQPEVIPNIDDERTTPSVVFFENSKNIIIGSQAKNAGKLRPDKVVQSIKRDMGTSLIVIRNGVEYRPETISSFILKSLVETAERKDGSKVRDVVITCPAYFSIEARKATKDAGELIGLNVVAIINEPTAAAIAYDFEHPSNNITLVYDLGGGTFDVSIISKENNLIKVIATEGDATLGGNRWDAVLSDYLQELCENETGKLLDNLNDTDEVKYELKYKAETMKKSLSFLHEARETIFFGGTNVRVSITRDKFNQLTMHLLNQSMMLLDEALKKAKSEGYEVNNVILVGGSSKMVQVREAVYNKTKIEPKLYEPQLAVAKGAAIYASNMSYYSLFMEDIATKSYGIVCLVNDVEKISNLIIKDSKLPCTSSDIFNPRYDNPKNVEFKISQNSKYEKYIDLTEANKIIGRMVLELPQGATKNTILKATFNLDTSGLLYAYAVEELSGNKCNIRINIDNSMTELQKENAINKLKEIIIT